MAFSSRLRFLCAAALAAYLPAQETTAVLEGTVVDSLTGAPVVGATVRLVSNTPRAARPLTAKSGIAGEFRFNPMPHGEYTLWVRVKGYVELEQGLFASESRSLTLRLAPVASIEGRVVDELRRPVEGATVYATANYPFQTSADSGPDGVYRLNNLAPGPRKLLVKVPLALRKQSATTDPETGETWALGSIQYYPGVDRADAASTVYTGLGMRMTGMDIMLRKSRMVDFHVRLVDPVTRLPSTQLKVELDSAEDEFRDDAYTCRPVDPKGTRTFDLIPPGRYNLLVYTSECRGELPFVAPVELSLRGPPQLEVAVPRPVRIEGVIKTPNDSPVPPASLLLQLDRRITGLRDLQVTIGGDRRFAMDGVAPGPLRIAVARNPPLPKDWYVAGIRLGSQRALSSPVNIAEGGNPLLEVELSDGAAHLSVEVASTPGLSAFVFARPVDLPPGERPPYAVMRRPDGRFGLEGLPPGEYIVALSSLPVPGCETDRVKVKLARGESRTIRLKKCAK